MESVSDMIAWIGRPVEVEFYDHVSGEDVDDLLVCRTWGKLLAVDEHKVVIQQWETPEEGTSDNLVLIRSAIRAVDPLVYEKRAI